jgi:nucleotidyltransferase/DNA polymerase involved in DNA repair
MFTASIAARLTRLNSGEIVSQGGESAYLAPLPIDLLPISDEAHDLLVRLGLMTLGQVAELPPGALSRKLGKEGEPLYQLSSGVDDRPLIPQFEQRPLSAKCSSISSSSIFRHSSLTLIS